MKKSTFNIIVVFFLCILTKDGVLFICSAIFSRRIFPLKKAESSLSNLVSLYQELLGKGLFQNVLKKLMAALIENFVGTYSFQG